MGKKGGGKKHLMLFTSDWAIHSALRLVKRHQRGGKKTSGRTFD